MQRVAIDPQPLGGRDVCAAAIAHHLLDEGAFDTVHEEGVQIDPARPREHMSLGFGIHRCPGNRLAEMQPTILWDEVLRRDIKTEVLDKPVYAYSNFLHAIRNLPVRIAA